MYGEAVFLKQWEDFRDGKIPHGAVTMHFVTDTIDGGPIICQIPVDLT